MHIFLHLFVSFIIISIFLNYFMLFLLVLFKILFINSSLPYFNQLCPTMQYINELLLFSILYVFTCVLVLLAYVVAPSFIQCAFFFLPEAECFFSKAFHSLEEKIEFPSHSPQRLAVCFRLFQLFIPDFIICAGRAYMLFKSIFNWTQGNF